MATDPTRGIQRRRFDSPFVMGSSELLDRVLALPPSISMPYLSVSVDWSVQGDNPGPETHVEVKRSQDRSGQEPGPRWRPAVDVLEKRFSELLEEHKENSALHDSLAHDRDRVLRYVREELDPAAQGACIVASGADGVFEATGFALPLPTSLHLGPTPRLVEVVRLVEDNPTYAVLHADQHEARLLYLSKGLSNKSITLTSNDYPRHQMTGGWSQARLQRRADERVEAFASDVAEEVRASLDRTGVETLIVAGNEVIVPALEHEFHESVASRIVDTIHLDIRATDDEIIDATQGIAERAERNREAMLVSNIRDQVGSDARGAAGAADTLLALQAGQVQELGLSDTFDATGWADFSMELYGVGDVPAEHPAGGDVGSIVPVDVPNEMIRLALSQDAKIDVIHSNVPAETDQPVRQSENGLPITEAAALLNDLGGVGAVLRFALDETAQPQSV